MKVTEEDVRELRLQDQALAKTLETLLAEMNIHHRNLAELQEQVVSLAEKMVRLQDEVKALRDRPPSIQPHVIYQYYQPYPNYYPQPYFPQQYTTYQCQYDNTLGCSQT